jgi:aspartate kinase
MHITVMKFGGTSVANAEAIGRVVAIVKAEIERGRAPAVVVSAMSGVTDRLFELSRGAVAGERDVVERALSELRQRDMAVVDALVSEADAEPLRTKLDEHFDALRAVLTAISILREAPPRSLDEIASTGELVNSRIVAAALSAAGVPAQWVDARQVIITNDAHDGATPLTAETNESVASELLPLLASGIVPVLGGYVGSTKSGVTTTLGRGGSDYSAAIIGAALDVARSTSHVARGTSSTSHTARGTSHVSAPWVEKVRVEIWTDVDGMLTADPRVIAGPRVVPELSFEEASELAYFGAKVLHPSTIVPAVERDIPVRILNSHRPDAEGTLITGSPAPRLNALAAIACKRNITVIEVTSTRMLMAHGFMRRLFEVFERHCTSVDVVTTSEVSVSITLDDDRKVDVIVADLKEFAEVLVVRELALLCAVGDNLRADPTLAVRILGSLEGFSLRMVSQAASRRNLTIVLNDHDLPAAMARLHDAWFAEPAQLPRRSATA